MKRLLFFTLASISLGLIYLIGWSSLFTISSVTIETTDPKNVILIEGELVKGGLTLGIGEPLARINTRAIERVLKEQPWIGEVNLERDWIGGDVRLFVRERVPRFILTRALPINTGTQSQVDQNERFMTDDGTLFELPGDLAAEYKELPAIEIQSDSVKDRSGAAELFEVVDERFPTRKVIVTSLSTFITESRVPLSSRTASDPDTQSQQGTPPEKVVRISWGGLEEIEAKVLVVEELMKLKANREVSQIDVSNPRLPIVSR